MSRCHWLDLPASVREAVQVRIGGVVRAVPVATGSVSDLVAVLHTRQDVHFCKAVVASNPQGWMHRNEARINPRLPPGVDVPRLIWQVDLDGWFVLGFEHLDGRHPDLSVGSADLVPISRVLTDLAAALSPCPFPQVQAATERWAGRIPPDLVDGNTLLHTDLTPRNFLIDGDRVAVVDWSMPCRGAAWIDTARMIVRIIRAGHTPPEAEAWADRIPAWTAAPRGAVDAFAYASATLSAQRHRQSIASHTGPLADAAARWARHRATLADGRVTGS